MSLLADLDRWRDAGVITLPQHEALAALVSKRRFSVFAELNALLYVGVLSFVAGAGWTIQTHFASLGDAAIISALSASFAASLYYCFTRAAPYSNAQQESTGFAFDYVLYFGCLMFGLELGFLEYRFHFLQDSWDHYLLLSAVVYFAFAYRFDNRFVLSLALSTLAGWFGFRLFRLQWFDGSVRVHALLYSALVAASGGWLRNTGIKKHFFETYLHVAANVALAALVAGVFDDHASSMYVVALLALAGGAAFMGLRFRRFAFVAYGVIYSYVGISYLLLRGSRTAAEVFGYFGVSATVVIVLLVLVARRFGREP
jgi:Predicted membrane protein (DUF2157)